MKPSAKKHLRAIRRDLVHAAGCTEPNCATKGFHGLLYIASESTARVRVPRSLRQLLGRITGDIDPENAEELDAFLDNHARRFPGAI